MNAWCPVCNGLTDFIEDGFIPYGEEHEAYCRHCSVCGMKVFGHVKRVRGMTLDQQNTATSMAAMREPDPTPVNADASITFKVQGRAPFPYTIIFWRLGKKISSSCDCFAGQGSYICKHRLALLQGNVTSLVDNDLANLHALHDMMIGSDAEEAYQLYRSKPNTMSEKELRKALREHGD